MKYIGLVFGLLALAGANKPVLAETIAGGPVFAANQKTVRCMVFNAGPGVATITKKYITTGGTPVTLFFNSCRATLGVGKICLIAATNVEVVTHACSFEFTGGSLRGTIAVYTTSETFPQQFSDMR